MRVEKHFMESLIQNLVSGPVIWKLSAGLLQPFKEKSIDFVQEGEERADFRTVGDNKKKRKLEKLRREHSENQAENVKKGPKTRCGESFMFSSCLEVTQHSIHWAGNFFM